jgi:small conductance mechanosensitive channel
MKVKAGTQWGLKREFNRRLKNRFDELGIEIPFPQRTITFGQDKEGNAVAGRIVVADKRATAQPAAAGKARIVQDKGAATDGDGSD